MLDMSSYFVGLPPGLQGGTWPFFLGLVLMVGGLTTVIVLRIIGWARGNRKRKGLPDNKARLDDFHFWEAARGDSIMRKYELNILRIAVLAGLIGIILGAIFAPPFYG